MARQVLPIVGAAIDIYFGGTGQVGHAADPPVGNLQPVEAPIGAYFGGPEGAELVFVSDRTE
jgi:hypothetical protein